VTVQVDSAISQYGTVVGDFTMISVTQLYVGAVPHENTTARHEPAAPLPFHLANNLRGCLRQVSQLDAIRLLHQHTHYCYWG